jgi:hypothetical protein
MKPKCPECGKYNMVYVGIGIKYLSDDPRDWKHTHRMLCQSCSFSEWR